MVPLVFDFGLKPAGLPLLVSVVQLKLILFLKVVLFSQRFVGAVSDRDYGY